MPGSGLLPVVRAVAKGSAVNINGPVALLGWHEHEITEAPPNGPTTPMTAGP